MLEVYPEALCECQPARLGEASDIAQFSYNLQRSESTGNSLFEIVTRQQLLTPNSIATGYKENSPAAYKFAKGWQEQNELARSCLNKTAKRMKKWADKKRRHMEYQVGDLILIKLSTLDRHKGLHKSLIRKYEGPFSIEKRVRNVTYRVQLSSTVKYHPVFHVSMLKPYHKTQKIQIIGNSVEYQ